MVEPYFNRNEKYVNFLIYTHTTSIMVAAVHLFSLVLSKNVFM